MHRLLFIPLYSVIKATVHSVLELLAEQKLLSYSWEEGGGQKLTFIERTVRIFLCSKFKMKVRWHLIRSAWAYHYQNTDFFLTSNSTMHFKYIGGKLYQNVS